LDAFGLSNCGDHGRDWADGTDFWERFAESVPPPGSLAAWAKLNSIKDWACLSFSSTMREVFAGGGSPISLIESAAASILPPV
jgi:hypothetical protein